MRLARSPLGTVAAMTVVLACCSTAPAERVFVQLADGRLLTGEVDPRTNNQQLWLRSSSPTFVMRTTINWQQVAAVSAAGRQLTVEQFRQQIADFAADLPNGHLDERPLAERGAAAAADLATIVGRQPPARNAATRVTTIDVEAHVANWDRDAETDGLEIRVVPRNALGQPVPVSGQLTATLIGRNQLPLHDRQAFPEIGRWSLRTNTSDFGPHGAVYRLPFRGAAHPDLDRSLEPHGLVEASFSIFGQGRFAADAPVHLRTFNPLREDLQRHRNARDR